MVIDPGNSGVNKSSVTTQGGSSSRAKPSEGNGPSAASAKPEAKDSVSLSAQAQELSRLESAAMNSADVDEAKVAAVKQALANGSYQIDAESIAQKMLDQDDMF